MVSAATDMVTLKGRTDVAHIPYQPFWLLCVRGLQMLLAVIILALSAYAGSGYYFYAGDGIGIFAFVWTLLFLCYIEISTFFFPAAYNKYIHLVLECLTVIFWLSTWAALAVVAAAWGVLDTVCYGYYCAKLKPRVVYGNSGAEGATKGAAALGAIEWVLFCGTLITFGIYLHRHRRGVNEARQAGITGNAVVEEHKLGNIQQQAQPVQMQPTGYDHATNGYPQQQQYPQQYPPQQQQQQGYTSVPTDARYGGQTV